jgi:hypothetical protein
MSHESLPPEIEACRARAASIMEPLRLTRSLTDSDCHGLFLSSRTNGGRALRPYYLVYFLLVDLLGFDHSGRGDKVAWSIPVEFEHRLYVVEHRKFGLGIFEPQHDPKARMSGSVTILGEQDATTICRIINTAVDKSTPYFEWRAQQEARGSRLNVSNRSRALLSRYEHFVDEASRHGEQADRLRDEKRYVELAEARRRANWSAQAAIDAFYAWSEHAFIHLAVLQGSLSTGEAVRELATADWGTKFRAAFDLGDASCKAHYDVLVDLRKQMRNFLAHGSFGKRGEAFHFHSAVGAVPLLINQRDGHPFQLSGDVPFAESKALAAIDAFLEWLWGSSLAPAKHYLDSDLPTILTHAANGTYARVMQSDERMCDFLETTQAEWDRAGDMDF